MKHLDLSYTNTTNVNKRSGSCILAFPNKKKSREAAAAALVDLKHLRAPFISTTICLEPDQPYTIGRNARLCQLVFDDLRVSKQHCQIIFDASLRKLYLLDGVFSFSPTSSTSYCVANKSTNRLVDTDNAEQARIRASLNGVFVNGIRIGKGMVMELSAGDEVLLVSPNAPGLCDSELRIGFLIKKIVFEEGDLLQARNDGPLLVISQGHSQGPMSNGKVNKRIFALKANESAFTRSKYDDLIQRANSLSVQCRNILNSEDPISYIQRCPFSYCKLDVTYPSELQVKSNVPGYGQESLPCESSRINLNPADIRSEKLQSGSIADHPGLEVVTVKVNSLHQTLNFSLEGHHPCHKEDFGVPSQNSINSKNSSFQSLCSVGKETPHSDAVVHKAICGNICPPPGRSFYLNRLEVMYDSSSSHNAVVSLPELLYPVESISRIFIATFTSDILWFLSYCEIPCQLPITLVCHNTERCWSSGPAKRSSVPYPDFPNLVVVYPPFPEAVAFGNDSKKQGIACHHPKFFVLQRDNSVRVIITSANLVAKQWNKVTNTVWWQDFPRTSSPDYSSLFTQIHGGEKNEDPKSDFAAQLASFMASLLSDVPSQAHWILELAKYDFVGAKGHLIASVPGVHSYRAPSMTEIMQLYTANHLASGSFGGKFVGSVEASVVGLSHFFRTAADSSGAQLKKLADFLRKSCEKAYPMLIIVLRRTKNVPADANAVSVHVPNPNDLSKGDCVQLGFLPRNVAKWVSPLWDSGFFSFAGFVCPKDALAAAFWGNGLKVPLILHVSQGPYFQDISKKMQPELVIALCCLIASVQKSSGLWRLQEILGQYAWPESLESDFIYSSSSIGSSVDAKFLAAFSAACGKRSLQSLDSEESDPEWGCWNASQEFKSPSIRILFPTIERVKNACNGFWTSNHILCFSERTWQRLRTVDVLHDTIPHPYHRVGHPMHVKVARRRFRSKMDAPSFGWVYCGSHNFSAAAWGRPISNLIGSQANGLEKVNSSLGTRLHVCNYELGIIFIVPPPETKGGTYRNDSNLDDIVLPFVMPAPKYGPEDRPATRQAMKEALAELAEQDVEKLADIAATKEMMEEILVEENEEIEATDYVVEEKEDEKAYANMLWSVVDSSESC